MTKTAHTKTLIFAAYLAAMFAATAAGQAPGLANCPVFPANNIWNTPVDQLPVSPSSSTWVATIGAAAPVHPDFGSGLYQGETIGISYVVVPGTQQKYSATFSYPTESDPGPYAIPLNAPIEGSSSSTGDRHVIAVDSTNCILYEMYDAFPQANSWMAGSGAIFNLLSDALRPATWTSADAAGLPIFAGLIRYDEIAAGVIRHAIRFTVPQTQMAYVWPARHFASSLTGAQYPPMGARFRLRADFDISSYSAINQIILTALKKYGMMLADNGSSWFIGGAPDSRWDNDDLHKLTAITGASFEAVDVSSLMVNANSGQALQTNASVTVAPATISLNVNAKLAFMATVANTPANNTAVTWDVNGTVGGNATVGFIDSISGAYTAPPTVPSPATVTIHAVSNAVPAAIGAASVTITNPITPPAPTGPVAVSITPQTAAVSPRGMVTFTASVTNAANTSVIWQVNGVTGGNGNVGMIRANGVYVAPIQGTGSFTVTAVSVADPTKSASAKVTLAPSRRRR